MNAKIALFDLDDTLADYGGQLLHDLQKIALDSEPPQKLFSSKPYLSARRKMITAQVGWWLNLPKFQLGWDVLEVVKELGYSISVLTKGPKTNHTAWAEKLQWCNKHLAKDIDGVTICHDKSIVYGAVLVDDFPAYIKSWLNHRPRGLVIMPAHEYNADFVHPQVVRYDGSNISEVRQRLLERLEIAVQYKIIDGMPYKIIERIPLDKLRETLEAAIPEIMGIECYECVEEFIYNENLRLKRQGIKYKYVASPKPGSGDSFPCLVTVESISVVEVE